MPTESCLSGDLLQARFFAQGDRYAHVISLGRADRAWPLLESVEGTGDDPWPPSPALQGLNVEKLPGDRRAVLMVGMAGRSHWSLAAELLAADGGEQLVLDFACRTGVLPNYLGNRYRLGPAVTIAAETGELHCPLGAARLTLLEGARLRVVPLSNPSAGASEPPRVEIEIAAHPRAESYPATVRWKFALEARA